MAVEVDTVERYCWECPECGEFNELDEEPKPGEIVDCEGTGCHFHDAVSHVNGL